MRATRRRSTAGLALALGAAVFGFGSVRLAGGSQAPADPPREAPSAPVFGERIDVELVEVDVWVSDASGDAVAGLGAGDFEVLHDGRPVAIRHFNEVRSGRAIRATLGEGPAGEAAGGAGREAPAAAPPSHVVVYFDQSRLHPTNYPALVRGLGELLGAEGVEAERVLLVRQDGGLFVEAPFGSTKRELEAALERLSAGTPSGAELDAETNQALEAIRSTWEQNRDTVSSAAAGIARVPQTTPGGGVGGAPIGGPRSTVGGVGTGGGSDVCGAFIGQIQPILASWARSRGARAQVTLSSLSDLVGFLAGLPGVKTLVYLSDGLDTNPGTALASYAASFCPSGAAQLLSGARFEEMTPRFLELTRHANANRVTLYALQASGLRPQQTASASLGRRSGGAEARSDGSFEQSQRTSDRQGLELIAGETGGRTVFNQNEFGPELRKIANESRSYYSLAFEPPQSGEGREHRIEVRLRDGSLTARYRRGYLAKDDKRWLTERIEGALNLGLTSNPLEVSLGAGQVVPGAEETYRLPLVIRVPAERLAFVPRQGAMAAEVVVRVITRAIDSSVRSIFDKTFLVKGAPGATGFASLAIDLELTGGVHLTAIGVQDSASREASFVSTTLQIGS